MSLGQTSQKTRETRRIRLPASSSRCPTWGVQGKRRRTPVTRRTTRMALGRMPTSRRRPKLGGHGCLLSSTEGCLPVRPLLEGKIDSNTHGAEKVRPQGCSPGASAVARLGRPGRATVRSLTPYRAVETTSVTRPSFELNLMGFVGL